MQKTLNIKNNVVADSRIDTTRGVNRASNASILVLDDKCEIINIIVGFARMEGFGAFTSGCNAEALQHIFNEEKFAALRMVFLDMEVGADHGLDVYHIIRAKSSTLPIVIMSGSTCHQELNPILTFDVCASFMAKPFESSTVRNLIQDPLAWGGDCSRLIRTAYTFDGSIT